MPTLQIARTMVGRCRIHAAHWRHRLTHCRRKASQRQHRLSRCRMNAAFCRHSVSDCRTKAPDCRHSVTDCRTKASDCRHSVTDCRTKIALIRRRKKILSPRRRFQFPFLTTIGLVEIPAQRRSCHALGDPNRWVCPEGDARVDGCERSQRTQESKGESFKPALCVHAAKD